MAMKFDWVKEINARLESHGLSVLTKEDILIKNSVAFNEVLRDVHEQWPKTPFMNLILSLHEHYSTKFLAKILDAQNKTEVIVNLRKANPYGVHRKSFAYNRNDISEAFSGIYGDAGDMDDNESSTTYMIAGFALKEEDPDDKEVEELPDHSIIVDDDLIVDEDEIIAEDLDFREDSEEDNYRS